MEKNLGERQIVLEYLDENSNRLDKDFEDFEDAIEEGAPKKNEETATYYDDEYADNRLVVYVPEDECYHCNEQNVLRKHCNKFK